MRNPPLLARFDERTWWIFEKQTRATVIISPMSAAIIPQTLLLKLNNFVEEARFCPAGRSIDFRLIWKLNNQSRALHRRTKSRNSKTILSN
jgi:hypothetical protein